METVKKMSETRPEILKINLTGEEKLRIQTTAERIELSDASLVLHYGTSEQQKLASCTDKLMNLMRDDISAGVNTQIDETVKELNELCDFREKSGLFAGLFRKREIGDLSKRYDAASGNIDRIAVSLEDYRNRLLRDHVMLNKLYEALESHTHSLTVYIEAGQQKLDDDKNAEKEERERFEKRLHDLKLSRTVCMQTMAQIIIIQKTNSLLSENIQTLLTNTLSLWRNQVTAAFSMKNTAETLSQLNEANSGLIVDFGSVKESEAKIRSEMLAADDIIHTASQLP